jgi:uncharacterized protein (TIGR03437 family)
MELPVEFAVTAERRGDIHNNVYMTKFKSIVLLLPFLAGWQASAQSWDTSGNNLLNGTYYFRQVIWAVGDQYGDLGDAVAVYGTLSFNGSGQYTVSNVQVNDYANNGICTITQSSNPCQYGTGGNYSISASGYGFLDSLITSDEVYGLVSNGIFIASSTENTSCQAGNNPCYNDIFIAVPATGSLTNSAFSGTYTMADLDLSVNVELYDSGTAGVLYTRGSTFQMTPNGSGNVPGFTATGYIAGNGTTKTTQSVPSAAYSFSNGAAVYNLAGSITTSNANSILIAGQKYFYLSPDGNFVVGGSPTGWDMIVGVRTSSGGSGSFSGLYYQVGALVDDSQLSSSGGAADIQTYYGGYCTGSCLGNSTQVVGHQRIDDALSGDGYAFDYTYQDAVSSSNGQYSDSLNQYAFTDNGAIGIGSPTLFTSGAQLGLTVLVQSPSFSPSGSVYIYPTGVLNSGSSAPFTAQLAPGELVSIYGTNLASTTATDLTLPTTLGGTQVLINGNQAPIAFVSPTQINATVPITTDSAIATIQVVNGSGSSNTITNFVGETQPGIFNSLSSVPAVQHANYSMVTSSNPVVPGETILVYLTGLGTLSGQNATNSFAAYFEDPVNGDLTGTVAFAGSQSTVGGGYQMNITVPTNVSANNMYLDIQGPDSYNSEAVIPVGTSSTAALRKQNRVAHPSNSKLRSRPRFRRDSRSAPSHLQFRRSSATQ